MTPVTLSEAWDGVADCRNCSLRDSVLFAGLTEEDFTKIHRPIDQYVLSVGEKLYNEAEHGSHLFTLRSGLIKLSHYLPDGSQRIVRLARGTDVIGLETLVGDAYKHEAVALQPTEVCRFPAPTVNELSRDNPQLHQTLLTRWQQALNEADAWVSELSTGSAKQRMARLLIRLSSNSDEHCCSLFSREDMGAMLAITTETASRTIAEFKRQGLIKERPEGKVQIDVEKLDEIAAN